MTTPPVLLSSTFYRFIKYLHDNLFAEHFLLNIIYLFCSLIFVLIAFILLYLLIQSLRAKRKSSLQNELSHFIGEIAIAETQEELNVVFNQPGIQKLLAQFNKNNFDRNLLIAELAETCKKFRGSTMDNIHWLYNKLGLQAEVTDNLNSPKWHTKAKAIQQMAYLQQQNNIKDIFPFANHENTLLRMEAQIAIVKLTGFEGLQFLNEVSYPISEWQQLRLIQELSGHKIGEFENLHQWLASENDTVIHFSLRLVEIYRLYQYYDEVIKCLSHSSAAICKRAIETLGHISNENTAELLIKDFLNYNNSSQLKILKILEANGNENQVPFLIAQLEHPDDSFKMAAANAISTIRGSGTESIEELIDELSFPWNVILPQIKMQSIL